MSLGQQLPRAWEDLEADAQAVKALADVHPQAASTPQAHEYRLAGAAPSELKGLARASPCLTGTAGAAPARRLARRRADDSLAAPEASEC